jgi:hypothetical protein
MNEMKATTPITTRAWASRRRMKASMGAVYNFLDAFPWIKSALKKKPRRLNCSGFCVQSQRDGPALS